MFNRLICRLTLTITGLFPVAAHTQVTVWFEDFSTYPNCTAQNSPVWVTAAVDTDDGVPGCTPGQSYWGIFNGEFRCNDIEGPNQNCGNTFTTQTFNIQCLSNVTISFNARHTGTMECGGGVNSHDEIRAFYSINGGPWTQFVYVCGSGGLPNTFSVNGLSGNTIALQISMGNKSNDENYYIDNIRIEGHSSGTAQAGPDQTICAGGSAFLNATGGGTYSWTPAASLSCSSCPNPVASPATTTAYVVSVNNNGCTTTDTVVVNINPGPVVNLGNNTVLCNGQSLLLDAGNPGASFTWQNGSTGQTLLATTAGTYHVTATLGNCSHSDTIQITTGQTPVVNLGNDTLVCGNLQLLLNAGNTGSNYSWSTGATSQTISVVNPGTYSTTVTNACGSTTADILISQAFPPAVNLGNDFTDCNSALSVVLDAGNAGSQYLWNNGSTHQTYTVTAPGIYAVTVSNICGTDQDQISISTGMFPQVDLGPAQVLCDLVNGITLDAGVPGTQISWNTGSTNPSIQILTPGLYIATASNACGTAIDSVIITQGGPPEYVLENITAGCKGSPETLDAQNTGATYAWNTGAVTQSIQVNTSGTYMVDISRCGITITDTAVIQFMDSSAVTLFLPNSFTPNRDGLNDSYGPAGEFTGYTYYEMNIFDRWGEIVFQTKHPYFRWDGTVNGKGTQAPAGIYVVRVTIGMECGDEREIRETQMVNLIR